MLGDAPLTHGASAETAAVTDPLTACTVAIIASLLLTVLGTIHTVVLSANQLLDSHVVGPTRVCPEKWNIPNPLPTTLTIQDPVVGTLSAFAPDTLGTLYDTTLVVDPLCTPTLIPMSLLPPTPLLLLQTAPDSDTHTLDTHADNPTRARRESSCEDMWWPYMVTLALPDAGILSWLDDEVTGES